MIVASSGSHQLGHWVELSRDVAEDYRRAYGEEPGSVTGIGVMTDSDNTASRAEAYYGDSLFCSQAD